ncbi:MAG: Gfo/Idh/MocA family oxidoreductase [Planctomycetaceae bacterium]
MTKPLVNRRRFLQSTTLAAAAGAVAPLWIPSSRTLADEAKSPNARLRLGCIGTGDRWQAVGPNAMKFATCVAVCDVDAAHAAKGKEVGLKMNEMYGQKEAQIDVYEDYQKILERKDIDVVTIVTPDHWHSKIAIEAMQAGKDVYCEKPLTLTINEGKQIVKVLKETKRVFQVGTQQRTEMKQNFLKAIAMIRDGRIGTVKKVTCSIGGAPSSEAIPVVATPAGLNWDKWLGQAPLVDYRFKDTGSRYGNSRCHYEFRWWYEYSGGKMTDWGAHHVDIASWAIGMDQTGPTSVGGWGKHPVPYKDGVPTLDDRYNTATDFDVTVMCPNDVEMHIVNDLTDEQKMMVKLTRVKDGKEELADGNGILFEGTEGVFHVSRSQLRGPAFDALMDKPLPEGALEKVYGGKLPESHMANFIECVGTRALPISDVFSHHRAMTVCHLANIAIRLDRKINWDSTTEMITGDDAAAAWMGREQRKGYEINVSI